MRACYAIILALAACVTPPVEGAAVRQAEPAAALPPVPEDPLLSSSQAPDPGPLANAQIPRGQCGLVLWARSSARAVPIFRSIDDGTASMVVEGQPIALSLTGRGGTARLGIPSVQRFEGLLPDGSPIQVDMRGNWGRTFPSGSYVQSAALTLRGENGWSRVIPTAGVAGCRP
jgi:hypothetical protein